MPEVTIYVQGIREVQRALREVDLALPRQLRVAGNRAAEVAIAGARARASTSLERATAATLRGSSQQRSVRISMGGARAPFAAGAEFGASRDTLRRRKDGRTYIGYRQFKPWRAQTGYFLWPSIRANQVQIARAYEDAVRDVMREAGL